MVYYSQFEQDKYIDELLCKENGFFVDIGAYDGVYISNTLFFELHKGWDGICVEPVPSLYEKLKTNRKCTSIEAAITQDIGFVDFLIAPEEVFSWSGVLSNYDARQLEQLYQHGQGQIIKVPTLPAHKLFEDNKISSIDYLSIDTEGSEMSVLNSINFDKVSIDIISIEVNYENTDINNFLTTKSYELINKLGVDYIYRKMKQ